ncbi:hydroxypyruvate isomerase family protein [Glaciibacter superstes]|uniref:hydroxypyruvate isomerase family protein n=1 Tax=Glaciibacter superstes TaxID=501023 RepID=UPI0003B52F87|nr:TIM barrel protein [Glaciibacter superstes]
MNEAHGVIESRFELSANLSLLFTEHALLDRFQAAADAGFRAVELWWPFREAQPKGREVDDFLAAVTASSCRLTALNLFAGDMAAGERGIISSPDRTRELIDNLDVVVEVARSTGCRLFNALYGRRDATSTPQRQDAAAVDNLVLASEAFAAVGGTVLVEPLSGIADFPVRTIAEAITVIEEVRARTGRGKISLLYDTFHLAGNGENLVGVIDEYGPFIGHVQVADYPGRGEPTTGRVDFPAVFAALDRAGYSGLVACEYIPSRTTSESLAWISELPDLHLARPGL